MNTNILNKKQLSDIVTILQYESKGDRFWAYHEEVKIKDCIFPRSTIFKDNDFGSFLEFEQFVRYVAVIQLDDEEMFPNELYEYVWNDCRKQVNQFLGKF
jgi:hypothetical protein